MANTTTMIKDVQNETMEKTIKELKEWKILKQQAEEKIKALESTVKEYMADIGETNIACGQYTCKISEISKSTFDKNLVLAENPELYERACGATSYMRLTIK